MSGGSRSSAKTLVSRLGVPERFLSRCALLVPDHIRSQQKAGSGGGLQLEAEWKAPAAGFFAEWPKLRVCQPKYQAFVKRCDPKDLKNAHVFMNNDASAELVEYYLCCAILFRKEAVEQAGEDSAKLLALAEQVAREDVEPVIAQAQKLALEYKEETHRAIEELTIWREIDDALFWHHSFEKLVPQSYESLATGLIADMGGKEEVNRLEDACRASGDGGETSIAPELKSEAQRELVVQIYRAWLDLAGMPIKGMIRNCLLDHALLHGVPRAWEGVKFEPRENKVVNHKNAKEHKFI